MHNTVVKKGNMEGIIVELPANLSAKELLLNEMVNQSVRPAELARRLNTTPQEGNRLTNVCHTTRIDGIAAALQAMGRRLDMEMFRYFLYTD
jgi:antitoxin HicB